MQAHQDGESPTATHTTNSLSMNWYEEQQARRIADLEQEVATLRRRAHTLRAQASGFQERLDGTAIDAPRLSRKERKSFTNKLNWRLGKLRPLEARIAKREASLRRLKSGEVISSDDPAAIEKLEAKWRHIRSTLLHHRAVATVIRLAKKAGPSWKTRALQKLVQTELLSLKEAREAVKPNSDGTHGPTRDSLAKLSSKASSVRARIVKMKNLRSGSESTDQSRRKTDDNDQRPDTGHPSS